MVLTPHSHMRAHGVSQEEAFCPGPQSCLVLGTSQPYLPPTLGDVHSAPSSQRVCLCSWCCCKLAQTECYEQARSYMTHRRYRGKSDQARRSRSGRTLYPAPMAGPGICLQSPEDGEAAGDTASPRQMVGRRREGKAWTLWSQGGDGAVKLGCEHGLHRGMVWEED